MADPKPTPPTGELVGLLANKEMLETSIKQREADSKNFTGKEALGREKVLNDERDRLAQINARIKALSK